MSSFRFSFLFLWLISCFHLCTFMQNLKSMCVCLCVRCQCCTVTLCMDSTACQQDMQVRESAAVTHTNTRAHEDAAIVWSAVLGFVRLISANMSILKAASVCASAHLILYLTCGRVWNLRSFSLNQLIFALSLAHVRVCDDDGCHQTNSLTSERPVPERLDHISSNNKKNFTVKKENGQKRLNNENADPCSKQSLVTNETSCGI